MELIPESRVNIAVKIDEGFLSWNLKWTYFIYYDSISLIDHWHMYCCHDHYDQLKHPLTVILKTATTSDTFTRWSPMSFYICSFASKVLACFFTFSCFNFLLPAPPYFAVSLLLLRQIASQYVIVVNSNFCRFVCKVWELPISPVSNFSCSRFAKH